MAKVCDTRACDGCPFQEKFPDNNLVPPKPGNGLRLVIGEAPGLEEHHRQEPFVGGAGRWLDAIMGKAGIRRDSVWMGNVLNCQPPDNVFPTDPEARSYISDADAYKAVAHCRKAHLEPLLQGRPWQRIDLLGDKALKFVGEKSEGIFTWRGSPIPIPSLGDKPLAIATLHPAYIMRDQNLLPVAINDLHKSLTIPPERYLAHPSLDDVRAFTATEFAFDIEMPDYRSLGEWAPITMVGLCAKPYEAICVPARGLYLEELRRIFRAATVVVGHNVLQFDAPKLREKLEISIPESAEIFDTILAHHLRFPDLPHDLEFVSSMFTGKPHWKADKHSGGWELYNCRDVDVTWQIYLQLKHLLKQYGLERLYYDIQVPLARICHLMQSTGFKIDPSQIQAVRDKLTAEMITSEAALPEELRTRKVPKNKRVLAPEGTKSVKTGKPLKYLLEQIEVDEVPWRSSDVVAKWLYESLALPKHVDLKSGEITTGKMALEKLARFARKEALKLPAGTYAAIDALRKLRKYNSLMTLFCKEEMLSVSRMHPHFNVHGTASGRLSSSDPNLQNVPEEARFIYVPSHAGFKVIDVDFSQIENRLTAYFADDHERMQRFILDPKFSEHKFAASLFFDIPYNEVEKDNSKDAPYGKAKRIVHGCYPSDFKVLTPSNGWVALKDWAGEPIAHWNTDEQVWFETPKKQVISEAKQGTLLHLTGGRSYDVTCTWDHDFPMLRSGKWRREKIGNVLGKQFKLPTTGDFHFGTMEVDVRLAAAIAADAHLYGNHAVFHLVKPRKQARLEELLDGKAFSKQPCGCHEGGIRYRLPAATVIPAMGILDGAKNYTWDILELRKDLAIQLLSEIPLWDGSVVTHDLFFTSKPDQLEKVQVLAHLLGRRTSVAATQTSGYGTLMHTLCIFKGLRRGSRFVRLENLKTEEVAFEGQVYCFETSSGYFLVRSPKGAVFVGGNTNYGMGAMKISKMYDMPFGEVKELQQKWKNAISATTAWQTRTAELAKKQGYLVTPFGRKRFFWTSSYFTEALSFLPQSTAADVIFRAMLALMYEKISWPLERLTKLVPFVRPLPATASLLLQVHDSLVLEAPTQHVDEVVECVQQVMEQPWPELGGLSIPIGIKVGDSWGLCADYVPPEKRAAITRTLIHQ